MPHATAAWLVDNSSLTFEQIAEFCGLHILEVQAIADDTAATKLTGRDPIRAGELTHEEIEKGQNDPDYKLQMSGKRQQGRAALKLMDDHLSGREWFAANSLSLADVCLFAYTHVAGDAEFELQEYPHVGEWIERIKGQPRYVAMDA
jgi:hypothetical protein